jgi:hypothetical protein
MRRAARQRRSRTPKYALGVVSEPAAEEIMPDYKKNPLPPTSSHLADEATSRKRALLHGDHEFAVDRAGCARVERGDRFSQWALAGDRDLETALF